VLIVGDNVNDGLGACGYVDNFARFVGVRHDAKGAAPQNLEMILKTLNGVAPFAIPEARKRLQDAGYR
jgi:hypothetical protein